MEIKNWKYFYLTNREQVKQFEYDRTILREQKFTPEVIEIITKLKSNISDNDYEIDFMSWVTGDSMEWSMTKEISFEALDYTLKHKSFNYLHSILGNLFSFYNFFPKHRKYFFIKHGYPLNLPIKLANYPEYIIYKEYEELYETVLISDLNWINEIMKRVELLNMPENFGDFKIEKNSILFLQYENE